MPRPWATTRSLRPKVEFILSPVEGPPAPGLTMMRAFLPVVEGADIKRPVFRIGATFQTLIGLGLAMLVLIGPAASSGAHKLTQEHMAATASHHHAASTAPASGDGTPGRTDEQDGGHDHFQSLSLAVAALFSGPLLPTPPTPASIHGATQVKVLLRLASQPPPAEPPRFS